MTGIERREARIRRIREKIYGKAERAVKEAVPEGPEVHHHIGTSQNIYEDIGIFVRQNTGDPAVKVFSLITSV